MAENNRIESIEIIFQWPATKEEIAADAKRPKEKKRLVGRDIPQVTVREFVECDILVGPDTGGKDKLTRLIIRATVANLEPHYKTFYAIAHFRMPDGTDFFRTVMPRTEISPRLRALR